MREMAKSISNLFALAVVAALTGCNHGGCQLPDLQPIENGLRFLGVSAVVAVLAVVLGRSIGGGDRHD